MTEPCRCNALNCPRCSSAESIRPAVSRAVGMIRRARLTEAELDVCMQVGLHAVYAARRHAAAVVEQELGDEQERLDLALWRAMSPAEQDRAIREAAR